MKNQDNFSKLERNINNLMKLVSSPSYSILNMRMKRELEFFYKSIKKQLKLIKEIENDKQTNIQ